jgi:hypothetical protein
MYLREIGWGSCELDLSGSREEPVAGSCEYGEEPLGSIECSDFFEWLGDHWLLRKDSAPWNYFVSMFTCLLVCNSRKYFHEVSQAQKQ